MKRTQPKIKQPLSDELTESLLNLIETKFYSGHSQAFAKDRPRLLAWVVFYPARWLDEKGVTLPGDRYKKIMTDIILEAWQHGNLDAVTYLPAWLGKTVQSHWRIHGEDYYAEAKSMRTLVDPALMIAGKRQEAAPDPVREMAAASRLLSVAKGKKKGFRRAENKQLTML